ncbi:SGNH/GDSL hydrolase family protein [Geodermatophilus sp. SYSU D00710]
MVTALVAIVVMLSIAANRTGPRSSDAGGDRTPRPSSPAEVTESTELSESPESSGVARILVIGDSDTRGTEEGGQDDAGWPSLLERGTPNTEIQVLATEDAGYVTTTGDPTLADLVRDADLTDVDMVIISGSRYDAAGIADRVSAAAQQVVDSLRSRAPEATLLIIGPAWPGTDPPAGIRNNRDVVRAAAEAADVTFVDPLTEGWLTDAPDLVGADGVHLTDEGHAYLADRVQPLLEEAIEGRAAESTTPGG